MNIHNVVILYKIVLMMSLVQVWEAWEKVARRSTKCPTNLWRSELGLRYLQLHCLQRLRLCLLANQILQERYYNVIDHTCLSSVVCSLIIVL